MRAPVTHVRKASYLEKVEDAIVAELKQGVEGAVKVEAFPADVAAYDFDGLTAAALVHYKGSRFTARSGPADTNQDRRINFAVVLTVRNLRGPGGAYHALEDIRLATQGVTFEGAGPAEIVSDGLMLEDNGQWRWEIVIGMNAPAVARGRREPAPLMRPVFETSAIPGRPGQP